VRLDPNAETSIRLPQAGLPRLARCTEVSGFARLRRPVLLFGTLGTEDTHEPQPFDATWTD
jgi:hypothetical protein